jgi:hypothetical protein
MESRWANFGFLGSILLSLYGLIYFIVYHFSDALVGPLGASILMGFLGILAGLGGIFFSLGFLAFQLEMEVTWGWISTIVGIIGWGLQCAGHILLAANLLVGAQYYSWAIYALMFTFLLWGITIYFTKSKMIYKAQYPIFAGLLFLVNAFFWLTYFGFAILAMASLLCAFIFVPPKQIFGLLSPAQIFNRKRQYQVGQFGVLILSVYSALEIRWLVNTFFPIPVAAAAALNFASMIFAWIAILGIALVFNNFRVSFANKIFNYSIIIGIPSLLFLSLADLTWLMSNINLAADPTWSSNLYLATPTFWGLSALPLFIWALITAVAFIQLFIAPKTKGDIMFLILNILFIVSGFLWLVRLGYLPLVLAGILLLIVYKRK